MMNDLKDFDFSLLNASKIGIEREGLRVNLKGHVAQTPHPALLGKKLTNSFVTVDFSESLLELITPPFSHQATCFDFLQNATAYAQQSFDAHEMIWAASLPPDLSNEEIQIAYFGENVFAKMKQIYRQGLALRYGKIMQMTAGVHFNFSFSPDLLAHLNYFGYTGTTQDKNNQCYFRMIKQFHNLAWLLPYLFGCSPICAKSYAPTQTDYIQSLDDHHYIGPYATSLRMSEFGYQSKAQKNRFISYLNLQSYAHDLLKVTETEYPAYNDFGIQDQHGNYHQLNCNILQIENEYYNIIRPKQIIQLNERPVNALLKRGVEYVEVRLLDVDIFSNIGITTETAAFMEIFLMVCLLSPETVYDIAFILETRNNLSTVVQYGRRPDLQLVNNGQIKDFKQWGTEILQDCLLLAKNLDQTANNPHQYQQAVQAQIDKLEDVNLIPSAQVVTQSRDFKGGYHAWVQQRSTQYAADLSKFKIPPDHKKLFDQLVANSIAEWDQLEKKPTESLEDFLDHYFNSSTL